MSLGQSWERFKSKCWEWTLGGFALVFLFTFVGYFVFVIWFVITEPDWELECKKFGATCSDYRSSFEDALQKKIDKRWEEMHVAEVSGPLSEYSARVKKDLIVEVRDVEAYPELDAQKVRFLRLNKPERRTVFLWLWSRSRGESQFTLNRDPLYVEGSVEARELLEKLQGACEKVERYCKFGVEGLLTLIPERDGSFVGSAILDLHKVVDVEATLNGPKVLSKRWAIGKILIKQFEAQGTVTEKDIEIEVRQKVDELLANLRGQY